MKRPLDRSGDVLTVFGIDSAPVITNDLTTFLHPMPKEEFLSTIYRKKALAIKTHPKQREGRLARIKELLYDFHPLEMLRNSSSEQINVWMKTADNVLKSIKLGADDAKVCYEAGHSLYFRANEDLEAEFICPYAEQLGHGFASQFRDHLRRGEIETFATHIGHTTGWHWDFQENFTVQLRGAKRWTFKRGPIPHPHRAAATHFADVHVLHVQNSFHHYCSPSSLSTICVPPENDDDTESVVLQAGDVLYHPAGIWHKVETIADGPNQINSLSINVSLFPMTWAELMEDTLQHALLKESHWRERICFASPADARKQLEKRLGLLSTELVHLSAQAILPDAVFAPVSGSFTVLPGECNPPIDQSKLPAAAFVRRNPLGILTRTPDHLAIPGPKIEADGEDEDDDDDSEVDLQVPKNCVRFDYHANFAADEANISGAPAVHCIFYVHTRLSESFAQLALLSPTAPVSVKSLVAGGVLPANTFAALQHVGFLIPARTEQAQN